MIQFLKDMHSEVSNVSSQRAWGSFLILNATIISYLALYKGEALTNIGLFLGGIVTAVMGLKGLQKFAEVKADKGE